MALTKLGPRRFVNLDLVTTIETGVRAQHPDRTRPVKEQYVNDAVLVRFQGSIDPLPLFDDEAGALLEVIDKPTPAEPVKK